jgi:hypothetical protein
MIGKATIRSLRRRFSGAVLWALIPLAFAGGLPTANCACLDCHCGAKCACGSMGASSAAASEKPAGCCHCCCGHCSGEAGCCCCCCATKAKSQQTGTGFSAPGGTGCQTTISAVSAIQPHVVVVKDHQPVTSDIATPTPSLHLMRAVDLTDAFNTGPPVDLVVTLQRLVI